MLGKKRGHDVVITTANKLYEDSVSMFAVAEKKVDDANLKLEATIEELEFAIAGLVDLRDKARADKDRNKNFKEKLKQFLAN